MRECKPNSLRMKIVHVRILSQENYREMDPYSWSYRAWSLPCLWTCQLSEPINCIYYLSQFELGFILLEHESTISYTCCCLFKEGMSALFCYMWKLIFRVSLGRRVYVDLGQPKEWTLLANLVSKSCLGGFPFMWVSMRYRTPLPLW